MSFAKTQFVESLLATDNSQASTDEDTHSRLRRRGSFTFPRKRFFFDFTPTSESDSELEKNNRDVSECFDKINLRALEAFDRAQVALDKVEDFVQHVWDVVSHRSLPEWLKDNDYLISGHRPQLNSYWACFKSIFRIHTETGNIWSHLLGCLGFVIVTTYFLLQPSVEMELKDKIVYAIYGVGAILCTGFSWLFHTLYCHSPPVGKLFSKLDYCGIAVMIIGSSFPWLYYCFYCETVPKVTYLSMIIILGLVCICVSMKEKFADASYRPMRAALFIAFGCSAIIPATHFMIEHGIYRAFQLSPFHWAIVMGILYFSGAMLYAYRFPECMWPGKFDYWGQSHQFFHLCVVAAAFLNYHAMNILYENMGSTNQCNLEEAIA